MVGVDRVDRLFRKYTKQVVQAACVELLDYSERRMRQGLMTILPASTVARTSSTTTHRRSTDPRRSQAHDRRPAVPSST